MNSPNHTHEFGKIFEDNVPCGNRPQLIRRCRLCGYTEVVGLSGNISEHNFSKQEVIKPSTCTSPGEATLTCIKCGEQKSVSLPLTNHQYQSNNPFYKKCTICQKTELTPLAKRGLAISGTCLIIAGGTVIAISYLSSSISDSSSIITENSETLTVTVGNMSNKYNASQIHTTSSNNADITSSATNLDNDLSTSSDFYKESLFTKYIVPNNHSSNYISEQTSIEPESTEKFDTDAVESSLASNASDDTLSYESETAIQTEPMSEESSASSETFSETQIPESTLEAVQIETTTHTSAYNEEAHGFTTANVSEAPEIPGTTKSSEATTTTKVPEVTETTTSETTISSEITSTADYSSLIGKLFYGSEILDFIDSGTPVEIITSHGEKYYANIGENNFVSSAIASTDLYTVNTGTYDGQTIVIFNQL